MCNIYFLLKFNSQEILAIYNGVSNPQKSDFWMKLSFSSGILGQIGTLLIYQVLFKYIQKHNRIMLNTKIISYDTFQHRRNVNLFTMAGQLVTFLVELFFYVSMTFILILAEDRHLPRAMFIVGYFRMVKSGLVSIAQVLSSTDLRKELFSYIWYILKITVKVGWVILVENCKLKT